MQKKNYKDVGPERKKNKDVGTHRNTYRKKERNKKEKKEGKEINKFAQI